MDVVDKSKIAQAINHIQNLKNTVELTIRDCEQMTTGNMSHHKSSILLRNRAILKDILLMENIIRDIKLKYLMDEL